MINHQITVQLNGKTQITIEVPDLGRNLEKGYIMGSSLVKAMLSSKRIKKIDHMVYVPQRLLNIVTCRESPARV